jgi:hypothetical protein
MTLTVVNATANNTEAAISRTVVDFSTVIYGLMDWNATNPPAKTPLTGSGVATERRDAGDGASYAQWLAEWEAVSAGTYNFGPNGYTSLKVAQAIAEVRSDVGSTEVTQFAQVANWFASAATSITGVSWVTGNAIIVVSGSENLSGTAPPTPTNANLSFTSAASVGNVGDGSECGINLRYAIAGSSQSSQSISLTDPGILAGGAALWVINEVTASGAVDGEARAYLSVGARIAAVRLAEGQAKAYLNTGAQAGGAMLAEAQAKASLGIGAQVAGEVTTPSNPPIVLRGPLRGPLRLA